MNAACALSLRHFAAEDCTSLAAAIFFSSSIASPSFGRGAAAVTGAVSICASSLYLWGYRFFLSVLPAFAPVCTPSFAVSTPFT